MNKVSPKEKSILAFQKWRASMNDQAYTQIVYDNLGQLNRNEVAKGCGFAKSVLLQNDEVKKLLEALENDLRRKGILPPYTEAAREKSSLHKIHNSTAVKAKKDSQRVAELEAEVIALKAKLKRFEELSIVLINLGDEV